MHVHQLAGPGLLITALSLTPLGLTRADIILEQHGMDAWPSHSDTAPAVAPPQARFGAATPITVIMQEGDTPIAGAPVSVLNNPYTNDLGQVGFVGATDDGNGNDHFVWLDGAIIWRNSDATSHSLSGGEGTMGIADGGNFIYSPSTDGNDSVWTADGPLAIRGEPAPGFPEGSVSTFHSRPTMSASGAAHWVAGINFSGGSSSQARALYGASDATPATMVPILKTGDLVDGLAISSSGIDFDYWISDNGEHRILTLQVDSGSTANDMLIWVDGVVVARESQPTGDGDNWSGLDSVSINNNGDYLFSGDTDGPTASDEFIAYNGAIAVREGDTLDGVTLASGAAVQAVSINDLGQAAHIWTHGSGDHLFFACDAADLASSIRVLSNGDSVDLDGDGIADATVTDINASAGVSPGLDLAEDGRIALNVDLDDGTGAVESIIAVAAPDCTVDLIFSDGFEAGAG